MPVLACVLLFQSGLVNTATSRLALQTQEYVANAVAVSVGVQPTELNQITADLTKRETALAAREDSLHEREITIGLSGGGVGSSQTTTTFILATILLIVLILVVLNYVLDFMRARPNREPYSSRPISV